MKTQMSLSFKILKFLFMGRGWVSHPTLTRLEHKISASHLFKNGRLINIKMR